MKFTLYDLLRITAFAAVGAFLYSVDLKSLVALWLGGALGYEIGKHVDYWVGWVVVIGMVLGLWVWFSGYFSIGVFRAWRTTWSNPRSDPNPLAVAMVFFAIWLVPGLISSWLVVSLRNNKKR